MEKQHYFLWLLILSGTLLFVACLDNGAEHLYTGTVTDKVSIDASASRILTSFSPPKDADTVLPGDTLIFQSTIFPMQGAKTLDHWWMMDSSLQTEFFVKWAFMTPGQHRAVFSLIDQFGDTLSDTVPILVNSSPTLIGAVIPADSSWGISQWRTTAQLFSWTAIDPDPENPLYFHFRLTKTASLVHIQDSLILDTILNQSYVLLWKRLEAASEYMWSVVAYDPYGFRSDTTKSQIFSTATHDGTSVIRIQSNQLGLTASIKRFAGKQAIEVKSSDSSQILFTSLLAGTYYILLSDTLHPGLQPESLTVILNTSQLLNIKPKPLKDITPPNVICPNCTKDTLPSTLPFVFHILETGSGIQSSSLSVKLDQQDLAWTMHNDSLFLQKPSRTLVAQFHPIQIALKDSTGNDTTFTFWVKGGP
jgi:hypothetical protein